MASTFYGKYNNARTNLLASILAGDSSMSVVLADTGKFPTASSAIGTYFEATLFYSGTDPAGGEVVKVTNASSNVWTITRGSGTPATTPSAWDPALGTVVVELHPTAEQMAEYEAALNTGWVLDSCPMTQVTANTLTAPTDLTGVYQKGDKAWIVQNGVSLYFVIVNIACVSSVTTFTVTGGISYVVDTGHAITSAYFSRAASPFGWPGVFALSGFQNAYFNGRQLTIQGWGYMNGNAGAEMALAITYALTAGFTLPHVPRVTASAVGALVGSDPGSITDLVTPITMYANAELPTAAGFTMYYDKASGTFTSGTRWGVMWLAVTSI